MYTEGLATKVAFVAIAALLLGVAIGYSIGHQTVEPEGHQ